MISTFYGAWEYWELYQKITFDTDNLLIYVNPDVTELDIRTEVYSAYKNWFKTGEHSKLAPVAIRTIGGDDTTGDERAGDIYFLINGWRIVYDPRKVTITGVLFSDDYDTPWLNSDDLAPVYPAVVASLVTTIKVKEGFPLAPEIADAVWDEAAADHTITESMGEYQQSGATPVVDTGAIADAVWDKPAVESTVMGSHGQISRIAAYRGHIHVDQNNGVSGTTFPIGTEAHPVNNIADAVTIAGIIAVAEIKIAEDVTILATDDVSGFTIIGAHGVKSEITVQAGAVTELTQFYDCQLTGDLNGRVVVRDSVVNDINNFEGILHQTAINGTVHFAAGNNKSYVLSCYSGVPGTGAPEFDMADMTQGLAFRDYNGGIKLVNQVNAIDISIDFASGQLIINGTVTAGTIVVRGVYHLNNTSIITPVQNTNLDTIELKVDNVQTDVDAIEVTLANMGAVIGELIKYQKNRTVVDPVAFTLTIYDDDGVSPLHVFDLKDQNGIASVESIFERIPV